MNKEILFNILVKYDCNKSNKLFCDSLSNIIQNKSDENDIINIINFITLIDAEDVKEIDANVGIYESIF